MKQPVIRLHPDVFDKLDALVRDYYLRTGENITMSKIIDKLLGTVDKIEIVTITVNGTKQSELPRLPLGLPKLPFGLPF